LGRPRRNESAGDEGIGLSQADGSRRKTGVDGELLPRYARPEAHGRLGDISITAIADVP
jgi:hypothetical protein